METKRPTVPAAEEVLGLYCPVLDHGFVALIDYMGTDDSIERAARVSYGYGTRKQSQTRGLIRYLRRHLHTTPSEMVEFKFHCAMPIFVARQWIRHRTACLAEGTEIYFDLPGGIRKKPVLQTRPATCHEVAAGQRRDATNPTYAYSGCFPKRAKASFSDGVGGRQADRGHR
jgi:thymidylate synthase ThyX